MKMDVFHFYLAYLLKQQFYHMIEAKAFAHIVLLNQQDIKCILLELEYSDYHFEVFEINNNYL
jgi:hypothetical protein